MPMAPLRVLLAEDERSIALAYADALRDAGLDVTVVGDGVSARRVLREEPVELLISDIQLPGMSGMQLAAEVAEHGLDTHVVLMTAYGTVQDAVAAMKLGVTDYLTKPIDQGELVALALAVAGARAVRTDTAPTGGETDLRFLVGDSPPWRAVVERLRTVGPTDSTVLIQGASGTGKELIARALHACSPRRAAPFVAVNCAALSATLLESELFGHQRGAFTGAVSTERGRFELAHHGTLLLDEVDEIPLPLQVKLLRALQERQIERVGRGTTINVDVRLIATTKVDLKELVAAGGFRRDLYYRLSVVPVELPPLAERIGDVPELVSHFMRIYSARMPRRPAGVTPRAMELLCGYDYPGNVRELEHAIEAACVLCNGDEVDVEHLPAALRTCPVPARLSCGAPIMKLDLAMADFERSYLDQILGSFDGTRAEMAAGLGLSRKGLWQKLKKHGL